VIRDISLELLEKVRNKAAPFGYRRWKKHDGTEIITAEDLVLPEGRRTIIKDTY
jgi:hypothetical protein